MNSISNDRKEPSKCIVDTTLYTYGGEALDLGCAYGINSIFLQKNNFKVTAVDKNEDALKEFKSRISNQDIQIEFSDIQNYKYRKRYDLIICTAVLHFLDTKEKALDLVEDMKENTKEKGFNTIACYVNCKNNNYPQSYSALIEEEELFYKYENRGWEVWEFKCEDKEEGRVCVIIAQKN